MSDGHRSRSRGEVRQTVRAAAGSLVFLVVAPGTMAGLLPWLISGWQVGDDAPKLVGLRLAGVLVLALGLAGVLDTFVRFVREGRGTPAPVAPTELLVTSGPYRYVRNPLYLAVTLVVLGQALLLVQASLVVYAGAFFASSRPSSTGTKSRRSSSSSERATTAVAAPSPRGYRARGDTGDPHLRMTVHPVVTRGLGTSAGTGAQRSAAGPVAVQRY